MIELYEHNQKAYRSACALLEKHGKAAVIHPTGTGKSFIAFKLAEDHPSSVFVWISPSENIYSTQLQNIKAASGFVPENIRFLTYARLTYLTEEEIKALRPDYIILDEFHRAGAQEWGRGVQTLLSLHPDAGILGLSATNVRYLDHQRDMAEELFDGCIADRMNLSEAVEQGILPNPTYVVSFYAFQLEENKYRNRMKRVSVPVRREAEKLLEQLRRALDQAEGLETIFPRHMPDRHGKYIVFCAGAQHMQDMLRKAPEWFRGADPEPHLYTVWADSPSAEKDYKAFRDDESDHLRLLFCIDMFNEGIHVENLNGVILFRPTISPIVYKQQIGRALSAMTDTKPVIFDIVNNFENLYTISALREEIEPIVSFYGNESRDVVSQPFRIIDEVREARELFARLEDTLKLSWDAMYLEARKFRSEYGHLNIPKNYRTKDDVPLGSWLQTQRRVYRGTAAGILTQDRIDKLNAIGMIWENRAAQTWETGYAHAEAFRRQYGHLDVPYRTQSPDGYPLGHWLRRVRAGKENLSDDQIRQMENIGMVWDPVSASFQTALDELERYQECYGHIDVPSTYVSEDGYQLGAWLSRIRKKHTGQGAPLTAQQTEQLEKLGIDWAPKRDRSWEKNFRQAAAFQKEHGHLRVPAEETALFRWITRQREDYKNGKLAPEQIQKLESIGMQWTARTKTWEENFEQAAIYYRNHGDLEVPADYVTETGVWLGKWIAAQRLDREQKKLPPERVRKLDGIGMRWEVMKDYRWNRNFEALKQYTPDPVIGFAILPDNIETPLVKDLRNWAIRQDRQYRTGRMSAERATQWATLRPT